MNTITCPVFAATTRFQHARSALFPDPPVLPTPTSFTLGTLLERVDTGAFTVTRTTYGPGQRLSSHAHDLASATMVLRGGVTEQVAGRRLDCRADRFLVRPAAGVHPVHLTRAFRQCFGCSPGEYARQRRIDRACGQLAESDRPITAM